MRQPRCLGLHGLEIIIKRKTALSAGDARYFSERQLGPTVGIHQVSPLSTWGKHPS